MAAVVPFIPYIIAGAGAVYQGQQQQAQANASATVDEANAKLARQQAAVAEETQRRQNAMTMGGVRAAAVQTGFDPNSGSFLNLQTKTAGELELDALTTRYRGELESIGLQTDATVKRGNGRAARTTGYLNAAASIYGGQMQGAYGSATRINVPR